MKERKKGRKKGRKKERNGKEKKEKEERKKERKKEGKNHAHIGLRLKNVNLDMISTRKIFNIASFRDLDLNCQPLLQCKSMFNVWVV